MSVSTLFICSVFIAELSLVYCCLLLFKFPLFLTKDCNSQIFRPKKSARIGCESWFLRSKCFAQNPRKFAFTCTKHTWPSQSKLNSYSFSGPFPAIHILFISRWFLSWKLGPGSHSYKSIDIP